MDLPAKKVLNKNTNLTSDLRETFYKHEAPGWMGLCEQWSKNSLNPNFQRILSSMESELKCGGPAMTRGELEELIAGFYRQYHLPDSFSGARLEKEL